MSSGQCGYVLQPANMRDDIFDPFDKSTLRGTEPLSISIEVSTSSWCGGMNGGSHPGGYTRFGVREWFLWAPGSACSCSSPDPLSPCPVARTGRALAEEGHSRVLLRVPGEEQQEHPWVLSPGLLLSRSQCQQVASRSHRSGIPVPRAWPGCQAHPQANNTSAVPCPLLVTHLLQARCFHFPLLMAPLGEMLKVRTNFSGHFCVVLLVMIRGGGLRVGGARGWAVDA